MGVELPGTGANAFGGAAGSLNRDGVINTPAAAQAAIFNDPSLASDLPSKDRVANLAKLIRKFEGDALSSPDTCIKACDFIVEIGDLPPEEKIDALKDVLSVFQGQAIRSPKVWGKICDFIEALPTQYRAEASFNLVFGNDGFKGLATDYAVPEALPIIKRLQKGIDAEGVVSFTERVHQSELFSNMLNTRRSELTQSVMIARLMDDLPIQGLVAIRSRNFEAFRISPDNFTLVFKRGDADDGGDLVCVVFPSPAKKPLHIEAIASNAESIGIISRASGIPVVGVTERLSNVVKELGKVKSHTYWVREVFQTIQPLFGSEIGAGSAPFAKP